MKLPTVKLPAVAAVKESIKSYFNEMIQRIPGADVVFTALVLKQFDPALRFFGGYSCQFEQWMRLYDIWTSCLLILGVAIYAIRRIKQSRKTS